MLLEKSKLFEHPYLPDVPPVSVSEAQENYEDFIEEEIEEINDFLDRNDVTPSPTSSATSKNDPILDAPEALINQAQINIFSSLPNLSDYDDDEIPIEAAKMQVQISNIGDTTRLSGKETVKDDENNSYIYTYAGRPDVYLDAVTMSFNYNAQMIGYINNMVESSATLMYNKGCNIIDLPPLLLVPNPYWMCKKNRCSLYCIDETRIYRKFKGLYTCLGNNKWQVRKGFTDEKLRTEVTCEKPSCVYEELPFYENTKWYCNVNNNECKLYCNNGAPVNNKAVCKLKTMKWIIQGSPVRCVYKGWCDERLLPNVDRGTWLLGKGNRAASLQCNDGPEIKSVAICNKQTSDWGYPRYDDEPKKIKCEILCKLADLKTISKGWWEIPNGKHNTAADFHCEEGVTRKAARCDGETGEWQYKDDLRCYNICPDRALIAYGVGQWVVTSKKGQVSAKLYCDGEVTKNAAVCDVNTGIWGYKENLSCCSVKAQINVLYGLWERISYNKYRLFCQGIAQEVTYDCLNGMWTVEPTMTRDELYLFCRSDKVLLKSKYLN